MLTSDRKRALKRKAHALDPLVQIGKNGVTDGVIANIDRALSDHALIKVKYINHKSEKRELTETITGRTGSTLIDLIGNTAILYREKPRE
ncbi:MAG: ribosome assembly RNA-binding protein YhbY [Candidatus Bathyarchaeota archaeon]|nr:MAG: ribosome assembly RNA-binding protein YhbY [Candidatus Bathyarchaeota archaeon]